jgi:hypothetical protein
VERSELYAMHCVPAYPHGRYYHREARSILGLSIETSPHAVGAVLNGILFSTACDLQV